MKKVRSKRNGVGLKATIGLVIVILTVATLAIGNAQAQRLTVSGDSLFLTQRSDVRVQLVGSDADFINGFGIQNPINQDLFRCRREVPVGFSLFIGNQEAAELRFRLTTPEGFTYFTGPGDRNPDGQVHVRYQVISPDQVRIEWEDLFDLGDKDFNDCIVDILAVPVGLPLMEVTHIKFDHTGPDTNTSDGLNIRRDFFNDLAHIGNGLGAGEWIKDIRNEPALYVANQTVTIQARIMVHPDTITSADIEATALNGLLPDIVKRRVDFVNGISSPEYVTFSFDRPTGSTINIAVDSWEWRASNIVGSRAGELFDASGPHTVYTVLDVPKSPWYDNAAQHPWVSALEFTIVTASTLGIGMIPDATSKVTTFLHSDYGLKYDTEFGAPSYATGNTRLNPTFNLTNFISRTTAIVNCYDLAAAVSTMSDLIGSASNYHFMEPFGFINVTSLIGIGNSCNDPFFDAPNTCLRPKDETDPRSAFGNHAFVQSPNVYDANVGPHLGTETLAQYIANSIDTSTRDEAAAAGGVGNVMRAATIKLQ